MKEIEKLQDELLEKLHILEVEKSKLLNQLQQISNTDRNITPSLFKVPKSPEEKADLFLSLFGARRSVYPKLWINPKDDRKGYSPVCGNEWARGICEKPKIKCADCRFQKFLPLDQSAVMDHLLGQITIGSYAIREDDTCIFLAADFDGQGWSKDALAYQEASHLLGIESSIERSRSGEGGHVWIFFSEPIPARTARRLGTWILAKATTIQTQIKLSSYDRFFPNQDSLPQGGFGNLIALPLQKTARVHKNSEFIDRALIAYPDQWEYLSKVQRYSTSEIDSLLQKVTPTPSPGVQFDPLEFSLAFDDHALDLIQGVIKKGDLTEKISLILSKSIQIDIRGMPAKVVLALKRLATFPNPEFYQKQSMRFSTYGIPRFICSAEGDFERLFLPRAMLDRVKDLIKKAGGNILLTDHRISSPAIEIPFIGTLRESQKEAIEVMGKNDFGVLCAPPGTGKTVMGCALIAERKVKTVILVHRQTLLDQWKERLQEFLKIDKKQIGVFKSGKSFEKCSVVLAMAQSLSKNPEAEAFLSEFGQVIVDECHHIPAASFESVLKLVRSKYVLGLTATPRRKDGLERILYMQCGAIRHEIKEKRQEMEKRVVFAPVSFQIIHSLERPPIHLIWEAMIQDKTRNQIIVGDIQEALKEGRFCLVLSDRKEHLQILERMLKETQTLHPIYQIQSLQGKKERKELLKQLEEDCLNQKPFALLSTSTLIGEGFDLPRLDTLFLTMPLSFKGRLIQYAGRLHREAENKKDVLIYDYYEPLNGLCMHMLRNRIKAYRELGYQFDPPDGSTQRNLFDRPKNGH